MNYCEPKGQKENTKTQIVVSLCAREMEQNASVALSLGLKKDTR